MLRVVHHAERDLPYAWGETSKASQCHWKRPPTPVLIASSGAIFPITKDKVVTTQLREAATTSSRSPGSSAFSLQIVRSSD